jgi:hypothetical protein
LKAVVVGKDLLQSPIFGIDGDFDMVVGNVDL